MILVVQPEAGFACAVVRAVTRKTSIREDGKNMSIEIDRTGRCFISSGRSSVHRQATHQTDHPDTDIKPELQGFTSNARMNVHKFLIDGYFVMSEFGMFRSYLSCEICRAEEGEWLDDVFSVRRA